MPESFALLLLLVLPFAGAVIGAVLLRTHHQARIWALFISLATLVTSILLIGHPDAVWGLSADKSQFLSLAGIGFQFELACDGISIWLVLLTSIVTTAVILAADKQITTNGKWFYGWVLFLLGALQGVFVARDALLFYIFFELTLVPMLFIIGTWGGPLRKSAAVKFFIYTFAGSVFILIGLIYLAAKAGSFDIARLINAAQSTSILSDTERLWVCLSLIVGFLIKTPIFPLHTWQPLAYSESPMVGTVLMGALLSKLGTYGLLRLVLPIGLVGVNNSPVVPVIVALCLIGIIYGGLIAWVQKDAAKLLAYSSLSHLAICVLALLGQTILSVQGATFYMLAHGLSTAGLFLVLGMIQTRTGTRDIDSMSGLFKTTPILSVLFMVFTMSSIGLPLTIGFVGEITSLAGIFASVHLGIGIGVLASTGIVLGAIYMLHLTASIFFGEEKAPVGTTIRDINATEMAALLPIALLILWLGVQSKPVMDSTRADIGTILVHGPTVRITQSSTESQPVAVNRSTASAQ